MDIVKAGFMFKQSSFLHRWQKQWFVLRTNGQLMYFENQNDATPKGTINLPIECLEIKSGIQCDFDACSESNEDSRIFLKCTEEEYRLCAENADDRAAWVLVLEEARSFRPAPRIYPGNTHRPGSAPPNGPYQGMGQPRYYYYPPPTQTMVYGSNGTTVLPQTVVYNPDGTTTVVVGRHGVPYSYCYHHHRHCCDTCGTGAALGLTAGLAAGALLWTPFLWAPFWC